MYYLCRGQISSLDQTAEASVAPPRARLQTLSLQHYQDITITTTKEMQESKKHSCIYSTKINADVRFYVDLICTKGKSVYS